MVARKRVVIRSSNGGAKRNKFVWSVLLLVLKVLGIAFAVQGFIMQLAKELLYYGMIHYALAVLIWMLIGYIHKKKGI